MEENHMQPMDDLRERVEALEHHARRVERRVRWWRGIACTLVVLGLFSWALPSSTAQTVNEQHLLRALARRLAAVEHKLVHVSGEANEVVITGANLRIVNGLGRTGCIDELGNQIPNCPNGLGNLIVGYNEPRPADMIGPTPVFVSPDDRTGSHNIVVGTMHNFLSFGGIVAGVLNEITGEFASVLGGSFNIASGQLASVNGGTENTASADSAWVGGGINNTASGELASVTGGSTNDATSNLTWIGGGIANTASGTNGASVSGGRFNTASGDSSSVRGGISNTASGNFSSVSGGFMNTASGEFASVSGGSTNTASGNSASISGGFNHTAQGEFDWVAGSLFADQ
jgi:hypothetical protein